MNVRALALLTAVLVSCAGDDSADEPPSSSNPARPGPAGEAGAPGPPGEKGESGVIGATEAIGNEPGALPVKGRVATVGGRLVVTVSGAGYREGVGLLGIDVSIGDTAIGSINAFANEGLSHKVLPTRTFVVSGIPAGVHDVTISAQEGTITDANDFFNATVLEIR